MKKYLIIVCFALAYAGCSKDEYGGGNLSNDLPTGASAHDFLSAATYSTLTIQVQYSPGMQLQPQSINNLEAFLQAHLNKPDGINIIQVQAPSINKSQVTLEDVSNFEQSNRTLFTTSSNIGVYISAIDADYTSPGVGGVAYKNTSMVLLEKTIQASSGGLGQSSRVMVETGILEHEFGHLLGLVNNGAAMVVPHSDDAHKPHCNNKNCLMYYEMETSGFVNQLDGGIPQLDANCENDLKANGGK